MAESVPENSAGLRRTSEIRSNRHRGKRRYLATCGFHSRLSLRERSVAFRSCSDRESIARHSSDRNMSSHTSSKRQRVSHDALSAHSLAFRACRNSQAFNERNATLLLRSKRRLWFSARGVNANTRLFQSRVLRAALLLQMCLHLQTWRITCCRQSRPASHPCGKD